MAVMSAGELRAALGADEALQGRIDSIYAAACARIKRYARDRAGRGPQRGAGAVRRPGSIRRPRNRDPCFPTDGEGPPVNVSRAFLLSGAQGLLTPWRVPRAGATCAVNEMAVAASRRGASQLLHRPVVTAILQSASGGGVRTALATAALETCATLYASALSSCSISGPSSVTRALTADLAWGGRVEPDSARASALSHRRGSG